MRASKTEFEQRFWIFGGIFFVGFGLYRFDPLNFTVWLLSLGYPHLDLKSQTADNLARVLFGVGALLVFFSAMFRTWATAYLRTEVVHDMTQHSERMVADGPYRYTRNPLYLANLPMAAGVGMLASRSGWVLMVLGMWLFGYRLIGREEEQLVVTQGEPYRRYLATVPRFWPSFTPRLPSSGALPHWGQAFAGESMFWMFGLAMAVFVATLNFKITGILWALSFVVYFAAVSAVRKRAGTHK